MYQPTNTTTAEESRRARNALRENLWNDDAFAHRWLCHPERECEDGCTDHPIPGRLALYESEIEGS